MGLTLLEIQALTASLAANGRVPSTVAPPASTGTVTGIIPAAGATQTAGSGFTYTHTNGTGIYVFTFATAFAATPIVLLNPQPVANTNPQAYVTAVSTTGFSVVTSATSGGAAADEPFSFTAQAVT